VKLKMANKQLYAIFLLVITVSAVFGGYKLLHEDKNESNIQVEGAFNILVIAGVLFGIIKFASKVSLGCSFAHMNQVETASVAVVYFCISLLISLIIDILGSTLGSVMATVVDFNAVIGASQAIISIILLGVGLYTVKKWTISKKDVTKKASIFMVFPCPGTLITMFTTSALLIIAGINSLLAGFLVGGIFISFIYGVAFIVKKAKIRRNPASFGGVMIFFGILYIFSVLFVPAYIPVSRMDIPIETVSFTDLFPGVFLTMLAVLLGFLFHAYNLKRRYEVR